MWPKSVENVKNGIRLDPATSRGNQEPATNRVKSENQNYLAWLRLTSIELWRS